MGEGLIAVPPPPISRRRGSVQQLMQSYQRLPGNALLRGFRVSYKRHVLTMDDLQTLYGPNWLNDQVGGGLQSGGGHPLIGGGGAQLLGGGCEREEGSWKWGGVP